MRAAVALDRGLIVNNLIWIVGVVVMVLGGVVSWLPVVIPDSYASGAAIGSLASPSSGRTSPSDDTNPTGSL
jgi:hypothetical protein